VGSSADVIGRGSVPALTPSTYAQNQLAYEVSQWTQGAGALSSVSRSRSRPRARVGRPSRVANAWSRQRRCSVGLTGPKCSNVSPRRGRS